MKQEKNSRLKVFLTLFFIASLAFGLRWFPTFWAYFKKGDRVFLGANSLINLVDVWSYWSNIQEGVRGHWLFINPFGDGPTVKFFLYFPYLALGHLAGFFHIQVEVAYILAAYFLTIILTISLFYFSSHFFQSLKWRYFAVGLTLFSGGLSLALPSEVFPFLSLIEPNDILTQICMVLIFYFSIDYIQSVSKKEKVPTLLFIFFLSLLLSLNHVFINWLVIAILFSWLGINFYSGTKKNFARIRGFFPLLFITLLGSLPFSIYSIYLAKNPFFARTFINQNVLPSPAPIQIATELNVFLFLIPLAFKYPEKKRQVLFLFFWFLVQLLAVYFPVRWQLHLFQSWWISVTFLVALGIYYFWQRLKIIWIKILFLFFILFIHFASNFLVFWIEVVKLPVLTSINQSLYVSQNEVEAWNFLGNLCSFDKIVLTDFPRAGYLPAKTGCRSFVGHGIQTFDFYKKRYQLIKILKGRMSTGELGNFLQEKGINFIFFPKVIAQKAQLDQVKNLKLVFGNQEFVIYERI